MDKRQCEHCGSQLPAPEKTYLRITGLGARQRNHEDVFAAAAKAQVLVGFKPVLVMLESHSCDIDRQGDIAAWGIRALESLSREQQTSVRNGDNFSLMLLEGAGPLPPCVVDFNAAFTVPSWCLGVPKPYFSKVKGGEENALLPFSEVIEQRAASLSIAGLKSLYEAKLRHLTRQVYDLDQPTIEPEDPDRPNEALPLRTWWLPYPRWTRLDQPRASAVASTAKAESGKGRESPPRAALPVP